MVPTIAVGLLILLWVLSSFAGWGVSAFCSDADTAGSACRSGVRTAIAVSSVAAATGAALAITAWVAPATRRSLALRHRLLGLGVVALILAEATLFVGGRLAQY